MHRFGQRRGVSLVSASASLGNDWKLEVTSDGSVVLAAAAKNVTGFLVG